MRKGRYFGRFFREFIAPHRFVLSLLIVNVLVRVTIGLWWPYAAKTMVDRVLVAPVKDFRVMMVIIGVGFAVILVNHALIFGFNGMLFRLLVVMTQRIRTRVADHLLRLPQQFYDASQAGRLLTTAVGDPSAITSTLTSGVINALANAFVVLGGFVILAHMNAPLTIAISAVFPLMVIAFLILRPQMHKCSERTRESWGIICGMVAEKIGAVRVVRSFVAEEVESRHFQERVFLHRDLNLEYNWHSTLYGFLNGISIHSGYLIVFLVGGRMYMKGEITIGTIVAFYGYFQSLWPAILQICNLPQNIANASGSLGKVFRLLDEPLSISSPPGASVFDERIAEITFENVSFRYSLGLPWAVKNVNLCVKAGEKIGIVGPSGSGKSTLMALLLRFYDPTEGRITLNGRDLREWELHSLRRAVGIVPQEMILFSGTIRENAAYMRGDVSDGEIWEALEQADAAGFVRGMKKELDTLIGEHGLSISGGQKQRLSIARAILPRPQALILDNCTSALDSSTEQKIQATLAGLLEKRTAFVISHRIASVVHSHRVVVMDAGRIVEQGAPSELLERPGYFKQIYKQQVLEGAA